jgi:pSer/pThr/pTyr-binding forkhead associated (FHA) protein
MDAKSSREHAEIVKVGDKYVVTDLDSQNGIVINDLKVKQHELETGDTLIIGKTVLKYSCTTVDKVPEVVDNDSEIEDEEDDVEDDFEEEVKTSKPKNKGKSNKKIIIYAVVLALVAFIFLDDEKPKKQQQKSDSSKLSDATEEFINASKKRSSKLDKDTEKKLIMVLHNGLREYRERNYFRAIREFELALMLSPSNARASFYLNKTKQAMDEEIEKNFMKAKRDTGSLKYRGAVVSYCAIIKLLEGYPDDQRYKDAEENIRFVEKKMGLEKGEISCF